MPKSENCRCFAFSETWRHLGIAQPSLAILSVCTSFPRKDLLSRCFHFRVSEIFVSSLFLLPFPSFHYHCVSNTYEQSAGFKEEYNDDSLEFILRYNKDIRDEGAVVATAPSSYNYQ